MISAFALGGDARRFFRFTLPRIGVLSVLLLPLLYGALYLWTFWDPFGETDQIPVAIVNADTGATVDGDNVTAGAAVTESLIESGQLDLTEMSRQEALDGLDDGTYYFVIEIPENFSEAVTSSLGPDPQQADLIFTFNDANNYLASVMGHDAADQIINEVNAALSDELLSRVITAISVVAPDIAVLSGEADALAATMSELSDGIDAATDDSAQMSTAIAALGDTLEDLTELIDSMFSDDGVAGLLTDEVAAVVQDAEAIAQLIANVSDVEADVAQQITAVAEELRDNDLPELADALDASADELNADEMDELAAAADTLQDDVRTLETTIDDPGGPFQEPVEQIDQGLADLNSGLDELDTDATALTDELGQLAEGGGEVANVASELVADFSPELVDAPSWNPDQREAVAHALTSPVLLIQNYLNEPVTYGTGLAPIFLSLALFVGALIIWVVLSPLRTRPTARGLGLFRTVWTSYWPALVAGAIQALVLYLISLAIGIRPTHVIGALLFMLLVSATFLAMIQALTALAGRAAGLGISLALLMLMLVSSGGFYPVETTATATQIINPVDPMTYTVNGLRQLTVAAEVDSRLWIAVAVLAGLLIASFVVSVLSARRNRVATMRRLHPVAQL